MKRQRRRCLGVLSAGLLTPLARAAGPAHDVLRFGLTSVILSDQSAFLTHWGRYLSQRIASEVRFVARESYQAVLNLLFGGQIDVAWICGYPYVRWQSALDLIAVPQYRGSPTYQAYLIRPASGPDRIEKWQDLRQRVLAYSDPLSNSGWLVAQKQLFLAGLRERDLRRTFFAHTHRHVAEAVAVHLADAGSIDGYVWETLRMLGSRAALETEVVWRSDAYGFPPLVSLRASTHPAIERLRWALLHMDRDDEGRALLQVLNLSGFVAGDPALYEGIRQLVTSLPLTAMRG